MLRIVVLWFVVLCCVVLHRCVCVAVGVGVGVGVASCCVVVGCVLFAL